MSSDPILLAIRVAEIFEAIGVPYLVGGSLASSVVGEPRSTLDIDMVVEISESQIDRLIVAFQEEFLVEPASLQRAVRDESSTNLIHLDSATKVDLFVIGKSSLEQTQMSRRRKVLVAKDPDRFLYFYTPEDILLQKLRWYRLGEESSDRQWRDVIGIIRVQAGALDADYLCRAAREFGVSDLLERALAETHDADAPE